MPAGCATVASLQPRTCLCGPVGLSACEADGQRGSICGLNDDASQDLRTPLPAWQLDYFQSSVPVLDVFVLSPRLWFQLQERGDNDHQRGLGVGLYLRS